MHSFWAIFWYLYFARNIIFCKKYYILQEILYFYQFNLCWHGLEEKVLYQIWTAQDGTHRVKQIQGGKAIHPQADRDHQEGHHSARQR